MKTVPVIWKSYNPDSPATGYWDQAMVKDLLENQMWLPVGGVTFWHFLSFDDDRIDNDGAIVVIPARSNFEYIDQINKDLSRLKWVLLILTGDEENVFPLEKIVHPNIKIYVMSPKEDLDLNKYRVLGSGYPPQMHKFFDSTDAPTKNLNWFFAGQVTHGRRVECVEKLRDMHMPGSLFETEGFTQGLEPESYYSGMARAKVAPCPSGPQTPDTFRLFEALEAAAVPIADTRVTKGGFSDNYWTFFFGEEPPFPIIREYDDLPGYIEDTAHSYPTINNRVSAWWQSKKRDMVYQLNEDISDLSGQISRQDRLSDNITVVIPISPIKSHPETYILEETINSVRHHLPDCEIILTFDGVREEQEDRRPEYEEHIRQVLWKCNHVYKNVLPIIFDEHMHQTGMARAIIDKIKTPLLLYVEQDTPLVTDESIDWDVCTENILLKGKADVVRFHHEGVIPKEHNHMIHGLLPGSTMFMKTSQWSQRPHLATVAFYRRILSTCFSDNANSFVEDKMHGVCHEAYLKDGDLGWQSYRIVIYIPDTPNKNIKRSYHTDGRAGGLKYDDSQVW